MATDRILVVDDEELNRDVCVRRLERKGYSATAVCSGREALELVHHEPFDLILLDQMMPGLSGLEVLKKLRGSFEQQELPVIMVTAVSDSHSIAEALDQGANDYITKPIDFSVALARIRSQMARKHAESALKHSEQRYALAARGANDGLWDWNLETGEIFYSPRWKEMLGLAEESVQGSSDEWTSRIHPDDLAAFQSELRKHVAGESDTFACDYRMRHRDGAYRWMSSRGLAVRNIACTPVRMAGSQSDITEKITRDPLTGLANRLMFDDRLEAALRRARATGHACAVLFLDLDRFKLINDSLGHLIGDSLLKDAAMRITSSISAATASASQGREPLVARFGGDEFAILLEGAWERAGVEDVCDRIVRAMRSSFFLGETEFYCSISLGVVLSQPAYQSTEEIVRDADTAMYAAKARGGGRWVFFEPGMRTSIRLRLEMESDLRRAVERNEICAYYQPRVLLATGAICGFEALARWKHPTRGLIMPNDFIPLAEETGMIVSIGEWILREACRQARAWHSQFPRTPPLDVAVNVSVRQFHEAGFVALVRSILDQSGLDPHCLHLELTESLLLESRSEARAILLELKALGVGLKIDDFGTGYSCLRYLCDLPFDSLKIDRSFILQLDDASPASAESSVVRTIVTMADNLSMGVIAEGIERPEHVARLIEMGCRFGQGFLFSEPVDAMGSERLLCEDEHRRAAAHGNERTDIEQ